MTASNSGNAQEFRNLTVRSSRVPRRLAVRTASRCAGFLLFAATAAPAQTAIPAPRAPTAAPTFTPLRSSGIYDTGERAGWTVTLPEGMAASASAASAPVYRYVITTNNSDTVKTGTLAFAAGRATIEAVFDRPAMMYVKVRSDATPDTAITLGAAIAPTRLTPSAPRPRDFDAFWDGKLRALAKIPISPVLVPVSTDVPGVELYAVKLQSLGSTVQGYLAKPKGAIGLPALVIYQYAGVYPLQKQWALDRAREGWLVLNVDSHDTSPDGTTGVPQNYQAVGNTDRETSYFLNMYLRDTRAVDYIATRGDWNGRTLVVTGTSMGGQQSLVTAALNRKVTAVVVNEPAGADFNGTLHGRRSGYPNWPATDARAMAAGHYFDTVAFASRISAPVCVAIGFIDTTTPPVGIFIAYNQIRAPKEFIPMIESDHNHITPEKQGQWTARSNEVLALLRTGGTYAPKPMKP